MGLHRKRRRIAFGVAEFPGFCLVLLLVLAGTFWWIEMGKSGWTEADAYIVGIDGTLEGGVAAAKDIALTYEYEVEGSSYRGTWEGNALTSSLAASTIPREVIDKLEAKGLVTTSAIPGEVSLALTSYGEQALQRSGYDPDELTQQLSGGGVPPNIEEIAAEAGRRLRAADESGTGPVFSVGLEDMKLAGFGSPLRVRYNPLNPAMSVPDYPGFGIRLPYFVGMLVAAAATIGYFVSVYPVLKNWGY